MPAALLHPGVYIEEVSSGVRTITGVATSIALFVGWAPRGPIDRAVRLTSFADYERAYGGLDSRSLLGYAVRQFYDNGGSDAYVLRIADTATAQDRRLRHRRPAHRGELARRVGAISSASGSTVAPDDATRFRSSSSSPAPTTRCSKPSATCR